MSIESVSVAPQEPNISKGFEIFHDYLGLAKLVVQHSDMKPQSQLTQSYHQHPLPRQHQHQYRHVDHSRRSRDQLFTPTGHATLNHMFETAVSQKRVNSLESDDRSESPKSSRSTELSVYSIDAANMSPVLNSMPFFPLPPPRNAAAGQSVNLSRHHEQNSKNNEASKMPVCAFCRNNGESREFYSSHTLRDDRGLTTCPILRAYTCPLCNATGDQSHTIKYCSIYTLKTAFPPSALASRMGLSKLIANSALPKTIFY